jgi:predicted N-acetyltransferase YhbS
LEGPRGVRIEDAESLRELTDIVFRPGMPEQYPLLFDRDNFENLRICLDNGKVVTHIGMMQRGASVFGLPIRVCCIGAVSTHPDYRNLGLASACFDDAAAKAHRDGVDVMIVSGDRHLYQSRGCLNVGCDQTYRISSDSIPAALAAGAGRVTVETMAADELPLVMDCYRREPVRYLRSPEDYHRALESGQVTDPKSDCVVIRERGAFRGYAVVRRPGPNGNAWLIEFAGDRHAVLAALPGLLELYNAASIGFHGMGYDMLLQSLCANIGLQGTPCTTHGTFKLINFPQLMERMRPRMEELVGTKTAAKLRFGHSEAGYTFALGDEEFTTDRDTATYAVFGTPNGLPQAVRELPGPLGDVLRTILPLPTLHYGINYV